jgi:hypothetical protein
MGALGNIKIINYSHLMFYVYKLFEICLLQ